MAHKFIQHLIEDHQEQRRLGKQLQSAQQPQEREQLRKAMYESLYPHVVGEEASIFEYMQSAGGEARDEAMKAVQEHHVAKIVLNELMALSTDGDTFVPKAYVLDEMNVHHMDEEERTHFPMVERMTSKPKLDALFSQYLEAEEKAQPSG